MYQLPKYFSFWGLRSKTQIGASLLDSSGGLQSPRQPNLAYTTVNNSSAVAETGDLGHNRHGPKRGGCCTPFAMPL